MANAIRSRTIQKGIAPRGFSLVAFGGAGPFHGAEVAAMLEIPEVIVSVYPGITSALGLLTTDLKYDAIKTEFQVRGSVDLTRLNGPHIYSAAKAAVVHLTRSVARELGESGVRVNCICPGGIATPIFGEVLGVSGAEADRVARR